MPPPHQPNYSPRPLRRPAPRTGADHLHDQAQPGPLLLHTRSRTRRTVVRPLQLRHGRRCLMSPTPKSSRLFSLHTGQNVNTNDLQKAKSSRKSSMQQDEQDGSGMASSPVLPTTPSPASKTALPLNPPSARSVAIPRAINASQSSQCCIICFKDVGHQQRPHLRLLRGRRPTCFHFFHQQLQPAGSEVFRLKPDTSPVLVGEEVSLGAFRIAADRASIGAGAQQRHNALITVSCGFAVRRLNPADLITAVPCALQAAAKTGRGIVITRRESAKVAAVSSNKTRELKPSR